MAGATPVLAAGSNLGVMAVTAVLGGSLENLGSMMGDEQQGGTTSALKFI